MCQAHIVSSMVFEAFKNVLNVLKNSGILERRPPPRRAAPRRASFGRITPTAQR
jgi:hypothetical protein